MTEPLIRWVLRPDLPALAAIYNHYILNTHVTFHLQPFALEDRVVWFEQFAASGRHQCFVAELKREPIGWSCSTPFKDRAAYDTSVETSVYLAPHLIGRGIGKMLYSRLLDALCGADVHRAYGFVSQPNPASAALHERLGYSKVAFYSQVGRKFGRFWDVAVYERTMDAGPSKSGSPLI